MLSHDSRHLSGLPVELCPLRAMAFEKRNVSLRGSYHQSDAVRAAVSQNGTDAVNCDDFCQCQCPLPVITLV